MLRLSVPLSTFLSSSSITPFPPLALPPYLVYFISNGVGGGELYQCDCRGGWLIERRPKNCLNALQMMGQLRIANDCRTSLTFEVFYVLQSTMIASIQRSLNCATAERNSIMQNLYFLLYFQICVTAYKISPNYMYKLFAVFGYFQ